MSSASPAPCETRPGSTPACSRELRTLALEALATCDWAEKLERIAAFPADGPIDPGAVLAAPAQLPGRPTRPELVPPNRVKQRSVHTPHGRAVLLHALAHIEFNAVNLALDAVWRWPGMPEAYYRDWLQVAREEALHFGLLNAHLGTLGHTYGDFPAHNGLWDMAEKTQDDLLARMALVPRTLEARGLDASPQIRDKLAGVGDQAGADILAIILRDEIGHVAIGNRWYRHVCQARGLDPVATYARLAAHYGAPRLKGPFNRDARLAAGFTSEEIAALDGNAHAS